MMDHSSLVSNSVSAERVLLLAKRTFFINKKNWLTGFAAIFGILTVIWLLPLFNDTQPWHHYHAAALLPAALFLFQLGGLIMTSRIFSELHSPATAFLQLTLPVTPLEKLGCAWLITAPLYVFTFLISTFVFINTLQLASNLFTGADTSLIWSQLFSAQTLASLGLYFMYHAAFLLGAVVFKTNQFIKTVLAIIVIGIFSMFSIGIFYLILLSEGTTSLYISINEHPLLPFVQGIIGIFLLTAAFIRLRNKQIV